MEEKYLNRFHSFQKSLAALMEARKRDLTDSFVLSGAGAKFGITFELAWKVMKDILVQHYEITNFVAGSPKEVLRQAFKTELIDDQDWMEMLRIRNELAHDYDETVIKEHCRSIVGKYIDLFCEFEKKVTALMVQEGAGKDN